MPKKVDLTKLQEKAARAVYEKNFNSSFKSEIQRLAQRDGASLARKLAKDPAFKGKLEAHMRKWVKENMATLVEDTMKDAHLTW